MMRSLPDSRQGFTLVEVVVVAAIGAILTAILISSLPKLNASQALNGDALLVASIIRQARSQTLASKDASAYGVHFENTRVVLFKGLSYSANDSLNISSSLHSLIIISNVALTGGSDVVFQRLTGETAESGSVTLALVDNPTITKVISISGMGVVNLNQ